MSTSGCSVGADVESVNRSNYSFEQSKQVNKAGILILDRKCDTEKKLYVYIVYFSQTRIVQQYVEPFLGTFINTPHTLFMKLLFFIMLSFL